jgi:hypothetical protein
VDQTPNFGSPSATDACDATVNVTFSDATTPGTCPQAFSVTRTWIAMDDCGNTSQCSRTIVVQDNTPPIINCPVVVSPIQCGSTPNFGSPTATDACDATVNVSFSDVTIPGACPQAFSVTRTWTAMDDCGNAATCSATVVVQDNEPPAITLPQGISSGDTLRVQCFGQDPAWDIPLFDKNSVTAIDLCDANPTVTFDEVLEDEGDCTIDGYINLYRLTWTATDDCGNSSIAFGFLALVDTIAPVINGVPADVTVSCDHIPLSPLLVSATDECLCACVIFFEETNISQLAGCQDGLVMVRSWTARDRCGNETTARQYITLIDTTGPQFQFMRSEMAIMQSGNSYEFNCNDGGFPAFLDSLGVESVISPAGCGSTRCNYVRSSYDCIG